jgi:hypothetical protein
LLFITDSYRPLSTPGRPEFHAALRMVRC